MKYAKIGNTEAYFYDDSADPNRVDEILQRCAEIVRPTLMERLIDKQR